MDSLHSSRIETRWGYSAEQLEAIRIFGKKDLTFGCIVEIWFDSEPNPHIETVIIRTEEQLKKAKEYFTEWNAWILYKELLWHEPHLEDVFRVAEEKWFTFDLINFWTKQPRLTSLIPSNENFNIPYNPTLSLLEQSEETKQKIINLFK